MNRMRIVVILLDFGLMRTQNTVAICAFFVFNGSVPSVCSITAVTQHFIFAIKERGFPTVFTKTAVYFSSFQFCYVFGVERFKIKRFGGYYVRFTLPVNIDFTYIRYKLFGVVKRKQLLELTAEIVGIFNLSLARNRLIYLAHTQMLLMLYNKT